MFFVLIPGRAHPLLEALEQTAVFVEFYLACSKLIILLVHLDG